MAQIEDGLGSGIRAKVDKRGRLVVSATTIANDFFVNNVRERYWMLNINAQSVTGADDYIMYIKNTGTKTLCIPDLRFTASAACTLELHEVTGTTSGGTTLAPVPKTIGSPQTPSATIESGANITGLTKVDELTYAPISGARNWFKDNHTSTFVIPPGQAVALLSDTGSITVTGSISLYETTIDLEDDLV